MTDVEKSEISPHLSHIEKFQISPHDRCGEILQNLEEFQFSPHARNLKFTLFFVAKSVLWRYTLSCCKINFVAIYALLRGENLAKNCIGGEKLQI